jgi:hypothetical protein
MSVGGTKPDSLVGRQAPVERLTRPGLFLSKLGTLDGAFPTFSGVGYSSLNQVGELLSLSNQIF